MVYHDGIGRQRLNLSGIERRTDGEYKLHFGPALLRCFGDGAEDGLKAILQGSHRGVNQWLTGQTIPGKVRRYPAESIMKRARMVELRRPVSVLEVEGFRCLRYPGQLRHSCEGICPVDGQASFFCIFGPDSLADLKHWCYFPKAFLISHQGFRSGLMLPV